VGATALLLLPRSERSNRGLGVVRSDELKQPGLVDIRGFGRSLRTELVAIADEDQVDHQPNHLARSEMLAGGLVGLVAEAPDQLLKRVAHL